MVLNERYNGTRNQTRNSTFNTRTTSQLNGNSMNDSSDDEPYDHGMRVGNDYQAFVPNVNTVQRKPAAENHNENAILIWSPKNNIPEEKLDEFIQIAKEKYGYNCEQALGMLCWHKYDITKALADMPNFTPYPDEWTVEDKVLFEQAFQFHDKHFHKIKQMLPDKSLASLVKYYYSWKKTRSRSSLMDRQVKKLNTQKDESDNNGSEIGSENDDSENGNETNAINASSVGAGLMNCESDQIDTKKCENCHTTASGQFHNTIKGTFCRACYSYWRRTGLMRNMNLVRRNESIRPNTLNGKRKPPRGMYINLDDLLSIAKKPGCGDAILKVLDEEVNNIKRQVQNNKQLISQLKLKTSSGIDSFRPTEPSNSKISSRWTTEEHDIAKKAFREYGKNFKEIADLIGSKNEQQVKTFYLNYERRYNLDEKIKEYEQEHGHYQRSN